MTEGGVLRQHYETDSLDALTLLAAMFDFPPPDDERLRATVLAIADDLTEDGFVLRYRTEETYDGLSGKEGSFLICSFWLVSAPSIVGEQQHARDLMERLLRIASPLGLYAEESDVATGWQLGISAVARALCEHDFAGWEAHELTPRRSPEAALRHAFSVFAAPAPA